MLTRLVNNNKLIKQYLEESTRGRNILDLVLSTEVELEELVTVNEKIGDHVLLNLLSQ